MNKYLLMCAAATLATSAIGTANAGSYSVHFGTPNGGSYCDGEIGVSTASYAVGQHVVSSVFYCTSGTYHPNGETFGVINKGDSGIPGGKKAKAGSAAMSDTWFVEYDGVYSEALEFVLETPIAAGGKWDLWYGFGSTAVIGNNGVLLAGQYHPRVPGKKAESSVAKLLASLKAK